MRHRRSPLAALLISAFLCTFVTKRAFAQTIATTAGDASIAHDSSAGTWRITAAGTTLALTLDGARDFAVSRLATADGASWARAVQPDTVVNVGGQALALGNRAAGFALQGVTVDVADRRLQLNATFDHVTSGVRVTRHYAVVSGSPTFEAWNTYTPLSGTPVVSDLNVLQLAVTPGVIRSLTGLQGDSANVQGDAVFTLQQRSLGSSGRFAIGAKGRASETAVPWIAIDGAGEEFYAALMWSGAWSLAAERTGTALTLDIGLPAMSTALRGPTDGPHVVFGVAPGGVVQASAALRSYVLDGIRAGRPLTAPVIYNTWFAYGIDINETSMMAEMDRSAALGAELFVLDAGWYVGKGATDAFDFDAGLGSWTVDRSRFPNGLRPLRDYAHRLGMKFGIWVEPERVNLALAGGEAQGEVDEHWLATEQGEYGSDHAAQICLSATAARTWILDRLTRLIDDVQPDYLKWDNNMWVNCDRDGHEHGRTDGNFSHVKALYEVLATLRERYPSLLIENVSGGGNRLDLGMLRYTDVGWMDDRTAPSVHVRHNLEGLSTVFPPAYLLSFVTDHEEETLHEGRDLPLYFRSRMPGVLGLCFRSGDFSEGDSNVFAREIAIYKALRDTLSVAAASLLTPQAGTASAPPWDVVQATATGGGKAVIGAFQTNDGVERINVKPVNLDPAATYHVQSVDTGALGDATGAELMTDGIDIVKSPNTAAHVLLVKIKQ